MDDGQPQPVQVGARHLGQPRPQVRRRRCCRARPPAARTAPRARRAGRRRPSRRRGPPRRPRPRPPRPAAAGPGRGAARGCRRAAAGPPAQPPARPGADRTSCAWSRSRTPVQDRAVGASMLNGTRCGGRGDPRYSEVRARCAWAATRSWSSSAGRCPRWAGSATTGPPAPGSGATRCTASTATSRARSSSPTSSCSSTSTPRTAASSWPRGPGPSRPTSPSAAATASSRATATCAPW